MTAFCLSKSNQHAPWRLLLTNILMQSRQICVSSHFNQLESRAPHFYLSSTRGDDQIRSCTYEQPCKSIDWIIDNWGTHTEVRFTLLSGFYNMSALKRWQSGGSSEHAIFFDGQRDCFPQPRNETNCDASLPTVTSIKIEAHDRSFRFGLENLIIQPDERSRINCLTIFNMSIPNVYLHHLKIYNVSVDVANAGSTDSLCITAPPQSNQFHPNIHYQVDIESVQFFRSKNPKNLLKYPPLVFDFGLYRAAQANVSLAQISNADQSYLDLNLDVEQMSTVFMSSMNFSRLHMGDGDGFIGQVFLADSSFFNTSATIYAINISISECYLWNSTLNATRFTSARTNNAGIIYLRRNILESSTIYVWANYTIARYNLFNVGYNTSRGSIISPILSQYLDSPFPIDARMNFWGDSSGPSTCCNPKGRGSYVMWATDFRQWCLDRACNSTEPLSEEMTNQLGSLAARGCFTESFCTESTRTSLIAAASAEVALFFIGLIMVVIIFRRNSLNQEQRYRILAIIGCIIYILMSLIWIADASFLLLGVSPNDAIWSLAGNVRVTSLRALIASVSIVSIFCIITIFLLNIRPGLKNRYPGIAISIVYFTLLGMVLGFVCILMQAVIPFLRAYATPYVLKDPTEKLLFSSSFLFALPSVRVWFTWATAALSSPVILYFTAFCIWQILRVRDYGEVNSVWEEVEARSSLLGVEDTSLLRGNVTARASKRLALSWIALIAVSTITILLSSLVDDVSWVKENRGMMHVIDLSLLSSGVFISCFGFFIFYWKHYRIVLLWLQFSLAVYQMFVSSVVVFFWIIYRSYSTNSDPLSAGDWALFCSGSITAIGFAVCAVITLVFARWLRRNLGSDISNTVQRHMEDIYDHE